MSERFDVTVLGGGPGGATAATLVAMQGHRVLLLEKEAFPVHKIGESLLPSTVNGICAMLGVTEELKAANFIKKYGGTFRWGKRPEPWTVAFAMTSKLDEHTSYAYQVERMKFDSILLNNARRKGVDVRERCAATGLLTDSGGRVCGVSYTDEHKRQHEAESRFVVDASGWSTTFNRHVGTRVYSEFFRNIAIYGYFENGARLPAPGAGNIFCAAFDRGWFWYIPLSATLTSVGAVIGQEYANCLDDGMEAAFMRLIGGCEPIRQLLTNATRVTTGAYGQVRVRKDYSYCHTNFWRPGVALVGDAACFIDPVFSSGVHLATYAGLLAARSINSCLRGAMSEERAFTEFEKRYQREYRLFYDFLLAFYDIEQELDSYYWQARKVLNSAELGNEAFIQLIAGIGGSGEQLYRSSDEYFRQRAGLSQQLFGTGPDASGGQSQDRLAGLKFLGELLTEVSDVQSHVSPFARRVVSRPLFEDGLVPTPDRLHWCEPAAAAAR
jgi:halogenation protein CepH